MSVVLPAPFGPTIATRSPVRDGQVDTVERRDAVRIGVAQGARVDHATSPDGEDGVRAQRRTARRRA